MIDTQGLSNKPLQDLLRDRLRMLNYCKRLAVRLGLDINGKRMTKFRAIKLDNPIFPKDYPDKCGQLLDILDIYIECKKAGAPVSSTTLENLLFTEFRALGKKILSDNK